MCSCHKKSGARLLYLANDDSNKAFSIAFKTPPADDTGVFHILEHSVLCGSDKFPVKEPFVDLLKSSMQTFLNALTFLRQDHVPGGLHQRAGPAQPHGRLSRRSAPSGHLQQAQPSLSRRAGTTSSAGDVEPDLGDSVAGDVVARTEAERRHGGTSRYNGVVYNEMKGALSDPDDAVLYDESAGGAVPPHGLPLRVGRPRRAPSPT